jgi:anti-anti-sigma factor
MSARLLDKGGYRLIQITGFLDSYTQDSRDLDKLLQACEAEAARNYVLDLSAVEYVNSATLGSFVRLLSVIQEKGCQVAILNPPGSVKSVLDLTGLSAVLPVVRDEKELQALLGRKPGTRVASRSVNFQALSKEIDALTLKGEAPADPKASQLGKLLGNK